MPQRVTFSAELRLFKVTSDCTVYSCLSMSGNDLDMLGDVGADRGADGWGARGRRFESCRPDKISSLYSEVCEDETRSSRRVFY